MENFEKKYNEALERMKSWAKGEHPECFSEAQKAAEFIFPELKESKDDRIVRCLLNYFSHVRYNGLDLKGTDVDEVIVWLEKQGKSNTFKVPETSIKNAEEVASRMQHIKDDMKPIAEFIINYANWNLHKDEWNQPTLTVPLFRVLDALIQRGKPYGECVQNIEKQGEEVTNINGEDYGIDGLYHAINILEKTIGKVEGYQSDDGILEHKAAINAVKELYKKQDEQKHFSDFNANDWYVSKVDGKIHKITYNPTNKFEPKFRVGDFITNDYCSGKVIKITNDGYLLDTGQGIPFSCEHNAHLWTIQDAKEGDVLIKEETEEPFIYNGNHGAYLPEFVGGYCGIRNGEFTPNGSTCYWGRPTCPATKEQRDQLFQKMEKAGYKWNAEKKELKNIEVVSKESKDERIKKTIIRILKGEIGYTSKEDIDKYVTWLEKQGKRLGADKVIEWLKNTIREKKINFGEYGLYLDTNLELPYNSIEDLINDFKEDFGLC